MGSSHQTGWTGIVARILHLFAVLTPAQVLEGGKSGYFDQQAAQVSGGESMVAS